MKPLVMRIVALAALGLVRPFPAAKTTSGGTRQACSRAGPTRREVHRSQKDKSQPSSRGPPRDANEHRRYRPARRTCAGVRGRHAADAVVGAVYPCTVLKDHGVAIDWNDLSGPVRATTRAAATRLDGVQLVDADPLIKRTRQEAGLPDNHRRPGRGRGDGQEARGLGRKGILDGVALVGADGAQEALHDHRCRSLNGFDGLATAQDPDPSLKMMELLRRREGIRFTTTSVLNA